VEAFGDAVLGDLDAVRVFGLQGAVFEGGGEEVDDGEREALAGVCCLEDGSAFGETVVGLCAVPTMLAVVAQLGRYRC